MQTNTIVPPVPPVQQQQVPQSPAGLPVPEIYQQYADANNAPQPNVGQQPAAPQPIAPQPLPPQAPQNPPKTPSSDPKESTFYLGDKKFTSMEEMASHIQQLESEKENWEKSAPVVDAVVAQGENLEDLMFDNPKKFVETIQDRAVDKMNENNDKQKAADALVDRFYNQYGDLKGQEDFVNMYANQLNPTIGKLPEAQQFEAVANAVRGRINQIRGTSVVNQEFVPQNNTTTLNGQINVNPVVVPVEKPKTMMEQLKELRKNKRRL